MRKKTSKSIQLVLITSVLASCSQPQVQQPDANQQRIFMRADSTAEYTEVTNNYHQQGRHSAGGVGTGFLWFMAFRHMSGGFGYANSSLHPSSVSGTNAAKSSAFKAQRGGFGRSARSSRSSSFGS
ncbi:hypothetical protein LZQ00_09860 [Sphingobacterium sp. SRCM116780]|uniref:hypothetical protein n=1 Tax=Sphingobacterium sp. SRCM116780 TaxID=2907623 RepID=UPI001F2DFD6C|nr:hypothetical protein [Sphingobacterium sp. SRCM116780]UIR54578.1 hypothetical protein LZQ00_09860 [Sphingobacterium sp. SRCM116780]